MNGNTLEKSGFPFLKTFTQLFKYLKDRGTSHTSGYYQYTNVDAAQKIFSQKIYLFSSLHLLNDVDEVKGDEDSGKRYYVASFCYGASESVAMWGLYCQHLSKAVRLHFLKKQFVKFVNELNEKGQAGTLSILAYDRHNRPKKRVFSSCAPVTACLADVVYADKRVFRRGDSFLPRKNVCGENSALLRYFTKHYIWLYEREVRLLIALPEGLPNYPDKIGIPCETLLKGARVMCGPCLSEEALSPIFAGKCEVVESTSEVHKKIRLSSQCHTCKEYCSNKGK